MKVGVTPARIPGAVLCEQLRDVIGPPGVVQVQATLVSDEHAPDRRSRSEPPE